ncbi:MAG: hypothetical protein ACRDGD_02290 [Candidatus Limnocylindria bacterium]
MPRTTLEIDASVLRKLKRRRRRDGRSIGAIASEILARAMHDEAPAPPPMTWISRPMGARIDLDDKEAVRRALEAR